MKQNLLLSVLSADAAFLCVSCWLHIVTGILTDCTNFLFIRCTAAACEGGPRFAHPITIKSAILSLASKEHRMRILSAFYASPSQLGWRVRSRCQYRPA